MFYVNDKINGKFMLNNNMISIKFIKRNDHTDYIFNLFYV